MNKVFLHKELCDQIHKTYEAKNKDYGDSFGKTYKDLGIISAVTRITDKYNRMVQLAKGHEANVKDESLEDTLMDMANYCLMMVMELRGEKRKEPDAYNIYGMCAGVEKE